MTRNFRRRPRSRRMAEVVFWAMLAALVFCPGISRAAPGDVLQHAREKQTAPSSPTAGSESKAAAFPAVAKKAVVIPVEDQVDYGLHAFLKRSVAEALKQKPDVIVFKVNTYGGELQSAFDIVDLLTGITQCSTYAFVEQKAISAGALISLASNRIAMGNGTTLGDCAPITQSGEGGIVMLGEKIQSPLRAKFRTLAERNGYPSLLAQAMVTADMGVVMAGKPDPSDSGAIRTGQNGTDKDTATAAANGASSFQDADYFTVKEWNALPEEGKKKYPSFKTIVPEGQLLTMTDREAANLGFSQGSFAGLDDFLKAKGWQKTGEWKTTWSENLVRMIGKFAPILMLLGFGALYLEFKTPGLSAFGAIGIACLAIAFGSKYAVGLANYTELLLLAGGIALFLVEIYVFPGTLLFGGLGVALMVTALTLSLQSYVLPDPKLPWELRDTLRNLAVTISMAVLALFIPLLGFKYLIPRLPKPARVISEATLKEVRNITAEAENLTEGLVGLAKTALHPTGKAVFEGKVFEVTARSGFIEAGSAVEIAKVSGNTISVKAVEAPGGKAAAA